MAFLCDSGVVDTEGTALCTAVEGRAEACVKPLLVRCGGHVDIDVRAYINISQGRDSPLLCTFDLGRFHAPRFARLLLDNGADTTSKVHFALDVWGLTRDTPMVAATLTLRQDKNDVEADDVMLDGSRPHWSVAFGCSELEVSGGPAAKIKRRLPLLGRPCQTPTEVFENVTHDTAKNSVNRKIAAATKRTQNIQVSC